MWGGAGKKIGVLALLTFLSIAIYFNALRNPFQFDDAHHIQNNPYIKGIKNIPSYFVDIQAFSTDPGNIGNYRPLLLMSHALNYWVGGLDPFGYHLVNLAFHVGSAFLLFLIVQAVLGRTFIALASALIFAVHPFNSEVVNYISARSSVMCSFFYLLAFYCWIKFRNQKLEVRSKKLETGDQIISDFLPLTSYFYLASLLAFLLGLLTKEVAITLPAILWLYDLYYIPVYGHDIRSKIRSHMKRLITYTPFVFLVAVPFVVLRTYLTTSIIYPHGNPRNYYVNLLTEIKVLLKYIYLLFLPVNLTAEHYVSEAHSILEWQVMIPLFLIISLLCMAICLYYKGDKEWRSISFFIIWFFVVLIPTTIIPLNAMLQENRGYLAAITFAVFLGVVLSKISSVSFLNRWDGKQFYVPLSILLLILVSYSAVIIQRNKVWKDDITLWSDAVTKSQLSPRAHHNLALAYKEKGNLESAITEYKKVIELDPLHIKAYYNMGNIYNKLGRADLAIPEYRKALEIDSTFYPAYNNIGMAYWKLGRVDEAVGLLKMALNINPQYTLARNNLERIYKESGKKDLSNQ